MNATNATPVLNTYTITTTGTTTGTITGTTVDTFPIYPAPPRVIRECVVKANVAPDTCANCKHSLLCLTGAYDGVLDVATTVAEQLEGFTLPCVYDNKIKLVKLKVI
jgi:hypothetical protein